MFTGSRRIFWYWLLLLLPTLGVGAGAILLLRREQTRLQERAQYADEARLAAVTARARLVVENAELLIDDVQTGLLETLAAQPDAGIGDFLSQLERSNPFVRATFLADARGRLLRPVASMADEEARGFMRRFGGLLSANPPWNESAEAALLERSVAAENPGRDEAGARSQVTSNVYKMQSARQDVKRAARQSSSSELADGASGESKTRLAAAAPSAAGMAYEATASKKEAIEIGSRGWKSWVIEGRLHRLGWVQPLRSGEVRGVEMEIAALVGRMGGALPAEVSAQEGYALRDELGRIVHQVGAVPRAGADASAVKIPFAEAVLPGWEVVAYLPGAGRDESLGGSIFLIGSLLVAIFVTAIVAGGSLLLWQARRSEAEAAQKTSFVANVSHEFKTPLTTIRLYSELLEQGRVRDAAQGGEYLRTIGRETQRLARLVGNVLDFSRLEQGQKKFVREPVELASEVFQLLERQGPRLSEAGLAVTSELPNTPVRVRTDRDAFAQIVLNLLDNACKYAAEGGALTVSLAAAAQGGAVLRVMDRGPGVPEEHRTRIFEKFHRVDDTLTAEKSGAGLGLSIARQLARGLGGELRCEARDGGGATFVLELP